ncbi:MAG: hypothetical protein H0T79_16660, partial [Deltaproteobacteria bacterium]|nr:hypothetical protein [Deltaproteobacteria bacterium]
LGAFISRHPWGAVGMAVIAGAAVGLATRPGKSGGEDDGRPALLATVALVVWRLARRAAFDFAATRAQDWVQEHLARDPEAARDQSTFH